MAEIQSRNQRTGDSWNSAPPRAAGLYGELQPLPLQVPPPLSSAMTLEPRPKSGLTD